MPQRAFRDDDEPGQLPLGCYLAIAVVFTVGLAFGLMALVSAILDLLLEVSP